MHLTYSASDPFDTDLHREVFERRPEAWGQVDTASDADLILERIRNERMEMRFRLTYEGNLKSAGKSTRGPEKWAIRKAINPQLAELWEVHPALQGYAFGYVRSKGEPGSPQEQNYRKLRVPTMN